MKRMVLFGFVLVACAHAPKPVEEAPAPVVEAPPAVKKAEAAPVEDTTQADIEAALKGMVIHFDFDRAELSAESQSRLQKLADKLQAHPKAQIKVAGNCDELGTEEYNLALGQRRADVAKNYLSKLGVAATRIDTVSFGEEKPANPEHSNDAYAANRRAEFTRN